MAQAGKMVIDQQEKIRDGSVRETWTLFSYARPKAHLLTTGRGRWWYGLRPSCALRGRFCGGVSSCPVWTGSADATGGLCIERSCADVLGAWGPSAANKRPGVYTQALLATTIIDYK